jgi:hypothetical protein
VKTRSVAFLLALFCGIAPVHAQEAEELSVTDGSTPLALTPGSPAGSFALSGFDTVNLYNGNLNFRLPLLTVAGRGDAATTLTLPIQRQWSIRRLSQREGPTWYRVQENPWPPLNPGYGRSLHPVRRPGSPKERPEPDHLSAPTWLIEGLKGS